MCMGGAHIQDERASMHYSNSMWCSSTCMHEEQASQEGKLGLLTSGSIMQELHVHCCTTSKKQPALTTEPTALMLKASPELLASSKMDRQGPKATHPAQQAVLPIVHMRPVCDRSLLKCGNACAPAQVLQCPRVEAAGLVLHDAAGSRAEFGSEGSQSWPDKCCHSGLRRSGAWPCMMLQAARPRLTFD